MTLTAVAIYLDQSLDVETFDSSQVTFDLVLAAFLDLFSDASDIILGELMHAHGFRNVELLTDFTTGCHTDAVDISESDMGSLVFR